MAKLCQHDTSNSGLHRLFEGQGQKEGHFSMHFSSQKGSLSCFNQPWGQFSVFCQPRGHFDMLFRFPRVYFSTRFGSQERTLAQVLAPRRALKRTFWLPGGHFIACFGFQEGTLSHVLAPRRALYRMFWLPGGHFSESFSTIAFFNNCAHHWLHNREQNEVTKFETS